jgi:NitT/TauT family transport system substrate-binding protein
MLGRDALRAGALLGFALALSAGCGRSEGDPSVLRVGHFPNVTHAQGLIGHARSRAGRGWFEEKVGLRVDWYVYNAGPSAMEAILAGSLDLAYVGPNPALNAHVKTRGDEIRVVAGAAVGGSALVVREGGPSRAQDFRGRRIATPQFGNTQDVSARAWLTAHGLKVTQTGGDATVIPTPNPDQLALLQRGDVDAVWTVEPWVSRLVLEAAGKVLVEESDALTTVLVARRAVLENRRDAVKRFVAAHDELTAWIGKTSDEARGEVAAELRVETGTELPAGVLQQAWSRLRFESTISREPFEVFLGRAQDAGFLRDADGLDRLVERP